MILQRNTRLEELERKFSELETRLKDSPEKEAISILHAMIHAARQSAQAGGETLGDGKVSLEDVVNLYKSAPPMEGPAEKAGLPVGVQAPDFTLSDPYGAPIRLSDFRGQNVILAFYPLDWSPACSDQLSLYQSELSEIEKHNARVLGISVDSIYSHGAWAVVRGITFPLLSDFHPKGEVAQRYDVMRDTDGFSERALFLIDGEGVIRYQHVSPALHKIPDIYELFEQLEAVQPARQALAQG
jgi:peroxiredoxin